MLRRSHNEATSFLPASALVPLRGGTLLVVRGDGFYNSSYIALRFTRVNSAASEEEDAQRRRVVVVFGAYTHEHGGALAFRTAAASVDGAEYALALRCTPLEMT